ncbi:hypothetical protein B0H14DRAFT_2639676 [Mycena olivaceomarginata]|nr:hypothetical protein B0H14DRAFT_2639676 [Mycena olivaceomarginata]
MRLRGGSSSDDEDDDCNSDNPGPSNHKRKRNLTVNHSRSRESAVKATDRISNTTEPGIQITLGNPSAQNPNKTGIYVDRVVNLDSAPEVWEVLDESPGCLEFQHKVQTIDAMVKRQCQDSLSGPTGSKTKSLAQVIILEDEDDWPMIMDCRRSNLSCGGFYTCSLADEDYLDSFERCGTDSQDFVSAPVRTAKMAEAGSLVAIATEFYHSVCSKYCRGTSEDSDFPCGGHAIMRKYSEVVQAPSDIKVSDTYCYRDPSMGSLTSLDAQIARTHFREGKHAPGTLIKQSCPAKLLILVPVEEGNMRAVIIPAAGRHHNHPLFPRRRVPFAAASQYDQCIDWTGTVGATTLRVDKSASTRWLLDGKIPQEIHPSLINTRKRRQSVFNKKVQKFPYGTGLKALTLEASWIMVDTTFAVVHGITNEWKLLVWLNGLDRCTVIGRVWSNRATREAFVLVWNGIFEAIQTITGQSLNFKVFSKSSSLLGVLGDSEGAQAQALDDVIILRRLNLKAVDDVATVDVDTILMFVWKTCLVHFKCDVFALETYMDSLEFQYLLSFPYLETDADIQEYYTFCGESQNTKLKAWWTHKVSYPWLLPSLNRQLSRMSPKFWHLTPSDTNPIEGSHAHDNQVNKTNATLLEAISSAWEFDGENTRIIKASLESVIWENGNNSIHARFSSQAARHARSRQKKGEATEKSSKEKDLEIQHLNARLNDLSRPVASSSQKQIESFTPSRSRLEQLVQITKALLNHTKIIDLDNSPPRAASPMKALNLFPGSRRMTPIAEHRSDFDYAAALNSDVLDYTLNAIVEEHPKYPIDGDDEVLASDPYPTPLSWLT